MTSTRKPAAETDEPWSNPSVVDATVKRANQRDPIAEHELATMYAAGKGVPRSEKDRIVWLARSAEHGNTDAQYEFGIALRDGQGVTQDFARAAAWLQRAAQSGHGYAQLELGLLYHAGRGVPTDNSQAYTWLNLAAAQGIVGANIARDLVLRELSSAEIRQAQANARAMSEAQQNQQRANDP
jgi:TPR repeat protein